MLVGVKSLSRLEKERTPRIESGDGNKVEKERPIKKEGRIFLEQDAGVQNFGFEGVSDAANTQWELQRKQH